VSIYISASLLEDFISCNRKVYYRLSKPERALPSNEMIIGEIVHSAIETYWDNEVFSQGYFYGEMAKRLPNESLSYGSMCLHNFHEHFQKYLSVGDDVEFRFKIEIHNDIFVVGKMDRISNGKVFDWKTARKPQVNISKSIQFILYNWAYKKLYNIVPSGVYYAALSTGNLVRYTNDESATRTLFNDIIPQAVMAIKNKNFVRNGVFRKACFQCSYREDCLKEFQHGMDSPAYTKE